MERRSKSTHASLRHEENETRFAVHDALNAVRIVERLAVKVHALHVANRFHGRLWHQDIFSDSSASDATLKDPPEKVSFGGPDIDIELCPPELRRREQVQLPTRVDTARKLLSDLQLSCDPLQIDAYQLTTLLARLITKEPLQSFLSSSRSRAQIPSALKPVFERALSHDPCERLGTLTQFQQQIAEVRCSLISLLAQETGGDPASFRSEQEVDQKAAEKELPDRAGETDSSRLFTDDEPLPFTHLGNYRVSRRIGRGGMGDVYLGFDPILDRQVALKVLPAAFSRETGFVQRFRHEAASAARLSHPNIVSVFFAGEDSGHFFFAMQYVEGESLLELLARRPKLAIDESVELIQQALAGLAHAHELGLVHRDIKPGNLLIDHRLQRLLLGDFGLVKSLQASNPMTATGTVMGTAEYISPEQGRGWQVDHRSDLYSLGVVIYQMLSGRLPFIADNPSAMIFQHVYEPPKPLLEIAPNVPYSLAKIVDRLLAKAPNDRYKSAKDVLEVLREFASRHPISASMPDVTPRSLGSERQPDVPGNGFSSSRAPAATTTSTSVIIYAPQFPAAPDLPAKLDPAAPEKWWTWIRQRAGSFFGKAAPELYQQLQDTQQQVDGAVNEYERRKNVFREHVADAETALEELRKQLGIWLQAESDAEGRARDSVNPADRAAAQQERDRCQQTVQTLQQEIELQQNELDEMQLRFSQINAQLQQLRGQRDLLNARLQVAQAQAVVLGGRSTLQPNRRWQLVACGVAGIGFLGVAAWLAIGAVTPLLLMKNRVPVRLSPFQSSPGDLGRFPTENLLGEEFKLDFDASFNVFNPIPPVYNKLEFACGGEDGIIRIGQVVKNSGSVKWIKELGGHRHSISVIAYDSSGKWIASGDESGEIRVWNHVATEGNELSRVLVGHTGDKYHKGVLGLKFNYDSSQLLSYGSDSTIRLWDVLRERELRLVKHANLVTPFALADGDNKMITARGLTGTDGFGSWDKKGEGPVLWFSDPHINVNSQNFDFQVNVKDDSVFRWFDLSRAGQIQTVAQNVKHVALAGDRLLAFSVGTDSTASTWDLSRGGIEQKIVSGGRFSKFNTVAISNDGSFGMTTTSDGGLQVWQLPQPPPPDGQLNRFDMPGKGNVICYGGAGDTIAFGGPTGISSFQLKDDQRYRSAGSISTPNPITAMCPIRSGEGYVYASGLPRSRNNVVGLHRLRRWRLGSVDPELVGEFYGHTDTVTGVALLENESVLLSGSRDTSLRLWSAEAGTEIDSIDVGIPINSIAVSPDERQVLVAGDEETIRLYDIESRKEIKRLTGHTALVVDVHWPAKGDRFVSASADRTIRVWDSKTMETIHVLKGHKDRVNSVRLLGLGLLAISGSDDGTVRFWNTAAEKETSIFDSQSGPVISVAANPFGTRAVSLGADQAVRLWDLQSVIGVDATQ